MIKTYIDESVWASETKPTTESTIGLLLDSNIPVINGVNVIVKKPNIGDAVVIDENNGEIKYIAYGTFNLETLQDHFTRVGVVYNVVGGHPWVVSYTSLGNIRYAAVWRLKITGYTLDGTNRTAVLRSYDNNGNYTDLSFTYNASTTADLVSQFNTWAETSGNDPNNRGFYMYVDDLDAVQFVEGTYTTWRQHSDGFISGFSSSANIAQEIPDITWNLDQDGISRIYNTVNIGAIKRWGGRTLNAVEAITANNTPISKASFESDYGINYRNAYETYDNYLAHNCAKIPVNRGVCSWRDVGKQYTYALADLTYKTKAGETAYLYNAPHAVSSFGYQSYYGLTDPGQWYIPDVEEMIILMRPITVGNTGISTVSQYDKVNQTIYAMNGNNISTNAYRWCSCRYDSYDMWFYNSNGYLAYTVFCYAFTVVPVCRL